MEGVDDTERTPRKDRSKKVNSGVFQQEGGILGKLQFEADPGDSRPSMEGSPSRRWLADRHSAEIDYAGLGVIDGYANGDAPGPGPGQEGIRHVRGPSDQYHFPQDATPTNTTKHHHVDQHRQPSFPRVPERNSSRPMPLPSSSTDSVVIVQREDALPAIEHSDGKAEEEVENLISPKKDKEREKEKEKKFWQGKRHSRRMSTASNLSDDRVSPEKSVDLYRFMTLMPSPALQHRANRRRHLSQISLLLPLVNRIRRCPLLGLIPISVVPRRSSTTRSLGPCLASRRRILSKCRPTLRLSKSPLSGMSRVYRNRKRENGRVSSTPIPLSRLEL
jgi:hypothetical protein